MSEAEIAEARSGFDLKNLGALVFFGLVLLMLFSLSIGTLVQPIGPSQRAACQNNQHEIWTAVQVFEHRKQRYPGWRTTLADRQVSWSIQLMPYLSMNDQYQVWSTAGSTPATPGIPIYVCPNDDLKTPGEPSLSYVVNCGLPDTTTHGEPVETQASGLFFDNVVTDAHPTPTTTNSSAVFKKDGTSQTLGLGENLRALRWTGYSPNTQTVKEYLVGFNWMYYPEPPAEPWLKNPLNQKDEEGELLTSTATTHNAARLNSPHGNVVVVTFADGHSMYLNQDIDYRVYNKLCTPDGSAQIREDWPVQEALDAAEFNK